MVELGIFTNFVSMNGAAALFYLIEKVLLKLSSIFKLRNFDFSMKMIAIAPHRWYVQPLLATYITFGVGYCFIHAKGNAKA